MGHFRRDERYSSFFAPSVYSEGVTGSYADYGIMGIGFTGGDFFSSAPGNSGDELLEDAKAALKKAHRRETLSSIPAENLTLSQVLADVSAPSAGMARMSVNTLIAHLQGTIALSWAARRLPESLQAEAIELAEWHLDEGYCYWCLLNNDPADIAAINIQIREELRKLNDAAGYSPRGDALSYLLSLYGDPDARGEGATPAGRTDVAWVADEVELAHQQGIVGIVGGTAGKSAGDVTCGAEVLRGLFTGKKPLSCDPQGNLYKNWGKYKWALRAGAALLIVGFAGNALQPYVQMFRKDRKDQ